MIARVLGALRAARCVGRIRCITPAGALAEWEEYAKLCDERIDPGRDLIDSLLAGLAGMDDDELALVAATDIPLLTAKAVDAFAERTRDVKDIGYGCVDREAHRKAYPQVRHTWVRLRDGTFCGAGLSVLRVGAAVRLATLLREFAAARKSPLRLAALFSPVLIARLLLGRVSLAELQSRARRLSGLDCQAIRCTEAELAVNVDCLADLRAVEAILAKLR